MSEYIGSGFTATLCAQTDSEERHESNLKRADELANRREAEAIDESIEATDALIKAVMRQALEEAGYRQHARGQWRKQRERKTD